MSDENKLGHDTSDPVGPERGVNLKLIYSLIALAIFAAVAIAVFIVLPFYHRR